MLNVQGGVLYSLITWTSPLLRTNTSTDVTYVRLMNVKISRIN